MLDTTFTPLQPVAWEFSECGPRVQHCVRMFFGQFFSELSSSCTLCANVLIIMVLSCSSVRC